jgi:hypothetical protein
MRYVQHKWWHVHDLLTQSAEDLVMNRRGAHSVQVDDPVGLLIISLFLRIQVCLSYLVVSILTVRTREGLIIMISLVAVYLIFIICIFYLSTMVQI